MIWVTRGVSEWFSQHPAPRWTSSFHKTHTANDSLCCSKVTPLPADGPDVIKQVGQFKVKDEKVPNSMLTPRGKIKYNFRFLLLLKVQDWENCQQRLLLAASQKMHIYNINIKKKKKKKTQYQHTQDSPASVPSLRTALFWSSGPATSVKTPSSFTKQSYKESFWTIKIKHQDFLSYDNIWQNNI